MSAPRVGVTITATTNFVRLSEENGPAALVGNFVNVQTTVASSYAATPQNRIARDPDVLGGMPFIRGTRIPVSTILDGLEEGLTPAQLIEHFPRLTMLDIQAALEYAGSLVLE